MHPRSPHNCIMTKSAFSQKRDSMMRRANASPRPVSTIRMTAVEAGNKDQNEIRHEEGHLTMERAARAKIYASDRRSVQIA
jgi:hypothetical protein